MIRVLIVEDQKMAQENIEAIVHGSDRYTLAGSIANAADAELFCMREQVDLILMDVCTARDESGIEQSLKTLLPWIELKALPEENVHIYSNIGFALLGQIAAAVTGMSYSQAVEEYILKPMGMNCSTYDFYIAATYPYSQAHKRGENGELIPVHDLRDRKSVV